LDNNSEQNKNSINIKYSVIKGNSKRYIKQIEANINKLIKRKKIINVTIMRYNISNKKIPVNFLYNIAKTDIIRHIIFLSIKFNKICKDSTFNLSLSNSNYHTITINHNYYKKNHI